MLDKLITWSIDNRALVIIAAVALAGAGYWAMRTIPVDAIPDLSDVQVIVMADFPGQSPEVVESQVTYPLTTTMLSVPHAKTVRGFSFFGLSMVYVIFEDGTDLYWARGRVLEALAGLGDALPEGVAPKLGPDATGVGWAYIYSLTSPNHDLAELRSIQDWYLKYELMSIDGVSEVASAGGYVKTYQVEVDPQKLDAFGLGLSQVTKAIHHSNTDVGGRLLELGETELMVQGKGYLEGLDDLAAITVGIEPTTETPILLGQVANIHLGPDIRRGVMEMDGEGEVVSGIVVVRSGDNALETISKVKARLQELAEGLPEGVTIHTSYDRTALIERAVDNLTSKLIAEMIVVALVILIFLLHVRSSLVAIVTLPLGILASLLVMRLLGISATIMSLGGIAIAIGVMVDASVVLVENLHKHKERDGTASHRDLVVASAREVGPALFFSLLVVTVSFLPVFTLEEQEGRMFSPLAYTKTFAMAAAAILAVTFIPVMMYYFVRGKVISERKNPLSRLFIWLYRPVIRGVLRLPVLVVVVALGLTALTWIPYSRLGSEFMPPLNEGDLLYMPTTPPGISITKAKELLQQTDKIIAAHPQVDHVLGKAGRADTATDPAPLSMLETHIILTPEETWPEGKTIEDIIAELDAMVQFPGLTNSWTMPIKTRIDMLATGIKTPVGIKLMGADLPTLAAVGEDIEAVVGTMDGVKSVYAERVMGGKYLDIDVDMEKVGQHGLTVGAVQDVIKTALGGMTITWTVEGLARYPVSVRYPPELRDSLDEIGHLGIKTPYGHTIPLDNVAELSIHEGPAGIKSENAKRTAWIYVDLDTDDLGGFVQAAKEKIAAEVTIPTGVSLQWSGQYEYMERAEARLALVIPLTILIIVILLFLHFKNLVETLMVIGTLPFALVGGVWLMDLLGFHMSVAVAVGFIALLGLAAETAVVMLVYLDEAFARYTREGRMVSPQALREAVMEGAVDRVRPKLMTVATTLLGLVPIMLGGGTGARVMQRIAAPMVGGLVSSTVLTLVIIPALYYLWKRVGLRRAPSSPETAVESEAT